MRRDIDNDQGIAHDAPPYEFRPPARMQHLLCRPGTAAQLLGGSCTEQYVKIAKYSRVQSPTYSEIPCHGAYFFPFQTTKIRQPVAARSLVGLATQFRVYSRHIAVETFLFRTRLEAVCRVPYLPTVQLVVERLLSGS